MPTSIGLFLASVSPQESPVGTRRPLVGIVGPLLRKGCLASVKLYPTSSVESYAYVLVSISPVPFVVLLSVPSWTAIGMAVGAEQYVHVDDIAAEDDAVLIRV